MAICSGGSWPPRATLTGSPGATLISTNTIVRMISTFGMNSSNRVSRYVRSEPDVRVDHPTTSRRHRDGPGAPVGRGRPEPPWAVRYPPGLRLRSPDHVVAEGERRVQGVLN